MQVSLCACPLTRSYRQWLLPAIETGLLGKLQHGSAHFRLYSYSDVLCVRFVTEAAVLYLLWLASQLAGGTLSHSLFPQSRHGQLKP